MRDKAALQTAFDGVTRGMAVVNCPGNIQSPGPWRRNATPQHVSGTLVCGFRDGTDPRSRGPTTIVLLLADVRRMPNGPTSTSCTSGGRATPETAQAGGRGAITVVVGATRRALAARGKRGALAAGGKRCAFGDPGRNRCALVPAGPVFRGSCGKRCARLPERSGVPWLGNRCTLGAGRGRGVYRPAAGVPGVAVAGVARRVWPRIPEDAPPLWRGCGGGCTQTSRSLPPAL